ncbi:unnamed protein product, partial [Allacma fusca]
SQDPNQALATSSNGPDYLADKSALTRASFAKMESMECPPCFPYAVFPASEQIHQGSVQETWPNYHLDAWRCKQL